MKILHRYILTQVFRNFLLCLSIFTFLFLIFDFFDRIDNILPENASFGLVLEYFILKIPLMLGLMLPVAMLVSVMLTIGLLSKNSEITAMRAAGLKVLWLAKPILSFGLVVSVLSIVWNETLVPYSYRRTKEIYNIDIRQKDKSGTYSQTNFWWRSDREFYAVDIFDSRSNTLYNLSKFEVSPDFQIIRRTDAAKTEWLSTDYGWNMKDVVEYRFPQREATAITSGEKRELVPELKRFASLPLPIRDAPADFYDVRMDPSTMSYFQLRRFIRRQLANGIIVHEYLANLYEKLASPFAIFIVIPVVLPFAIKSARSGSLALSFMAAFTIAFSYYAVHSFSIAMGEAEIWPALLSAWMANIILGLVGLILCLGIETPS